MLAFFYPSISASVATFDGQQRPISALPNPSALGAVGGRHQFRFIVSAEDGAEYPDLKSYVRRLMTQVEQDLGTKLDWDSGRIPVIPRE